MLKLPSDMRLAVWSGSKLGRIRVQIESSMAGTIKQGTVALKMVSPMIPKGADEKTMLEEDLTWMECHGLMMRPWCIKYEKIVQELQHK